MATKNLAEKQKSNDAGTTKSKREKITVLPTAETTFGAGGELHQIAADGQPVSTTNHGMPIGDDHNSLKAGPRGPVLPE